MSKKIQIVSVENAKNVHCSLHFKMTDNFRTWLVLLNINYQKNEKLNIENQFLYQFFVKKQTFYQIVYKVMKKVALLAGT